MEQSPGMRTIQIGFKAFDAHELLCHFLAGKTGAYDRAGLRVELVDTTFIPDEKLPPELFQVSCGAALLSRLRGNPLRVIFAAAIRPMFWLYTASEASSLTDLSGRRVATFPPIAPPWHFGRILCQRSAMDPEKDLTFVPARDDAARLGLLQTGAVSASVISSAVPPYEAQRRGFRSVVFFGDRITVSTTGLAVHTALLEREPALVASVVGAFRQGLEALQGDISMVNEVLEEFFHIAPAAIDSTAALYQTCFSKDGRLSGETAQAAIELMRGALGIAEAFSWQEVYDFSSLAKYSYP